jgi:large subunit ribosomal protein L17
MRHRIFGKQLSRSANERQGLFKNLVRDIILHGSIKTTLAKAKAVQGLTESLITKTKKHTPASLSAVKKTITDRNVFKKLEEYCQTRFAGRSSGYTRIIKLGMRRGDGAEEVLFSFVDSDVKAEVIKPESPKGKKVTEVKKTEKKEVKKEKTVKKAKNK